MYCTTYIDDSLNTDSRIFKIKAHKQIGEHLLVLINYPNSTNYEGNKILLYKDYTALDLYNSTEIDPYFTERNKLIARFRPDEVGWENAIKLAEILN